MLPVSGYIGEAKVIILTKPSQMYHVDQAILNLHLNHCRVIVENVNSRLKNWHCLITRWQH